MVQVYLEEENQREASKSKGLLYNSKPLFNRVIYGVLIFNEELMKLESNKNKSSNQSGFKNTIMGGRKIKVYPKRSRIKKILKFKKIVLDK